MIQHGLTEVHGRIVKRVQTITQHDTRELATTTLMVDFDDGGSLVIRATLRAGVTVEAHRPQQR